ncbi:MAG TPA: 2-oxoacid:ferredoxin oxidoreductase subunit gamma [Anaerolineae bacterium]|nr:2-oxoacid:ferredoxin oxidoreductase subunit gamma [Anaerolineae bacterium]
METSIIISGFGGQGALFAGQVLTYAAMDNGMEVTWFPSYGPEMRGGTAHCVVIISDEEIGSPLTRTPTAVIALNLPSLDKYEPLIQTGGVLIGNASLIDRELVRKDINSLLIPANEIAEEIGNHQMANMVCLGALLSQIPILPLGAIEQALKDHLPERKMKWFPANVEALKRGKEFALKVKA